MLANYIVSGLVFAGLMMGSPQGQAQVRDSLQGLGRAAQDLIKGGSTKTSATTAHASDRSCEKFFEATSLLDNARELGTLAAQRLLQMGTTNPASLSKDTTFKNAAKHQLWVPLEIEERVGAEHHRTLSKDFEVLTEDSLEERDQLEFAKTKDILTKLIAHLPADQPYKFRLALLEARDNSTDDANAFAAPAGYIYLTRAAARRDPEVITMLLAHEIAHVTKRHYTRWLQAQLVDSATEGDQLMKMIGGSRTDLDRVLKRIDMLGLRFTRFHIDQELESDACATRLAAAQADFDVQKGAKAFLALLASEGTVKKETGKRQIEPFDKAHPSYEERTATLTRLAQHWKQQTLLGKNVMNPAPDIANAERAVEAPPVGATSADVQRAETGTQPEGTTGSSVKSTLIQGAGEVRDAMGRGGKAIRDLFTR